MNPVNGLTHHLHISVVRVPNQYLKGHGFKSHRGLRFFCLHPMLATCLTCHLSHLFTELNNYHLSLFIIAIKNVSKAMSRKTLINHHFAMISIVFPNLNFFWWIIWKWYFWLQKNVWITQIQLYNVFISILAFSCWWE